MKNKKIFIPFLTAALFASNIAAFADYVPFEGDNVNVLYVGGSNTKDAVFQDTINGYIEENLQKTVTEFDMSDSALTSKKAYEMQADIISKNPDLIFFELTGTNENNDEILKNTESLVRGILDSDRNIKIVFMIMPDQKDGDEVIYKICDYYGLGLMDFEEFFQRRIDAGILSYSDILSGNTLNDNAKEMICGFVKSFGMTQYKKAVYKEKTLTGIQTEDNTQEDNEEVNNPIDENNAEFSSEEAKSFLNSAIILSVYKNTAIVNGEIKPVDKTDSNIKPAVMGDEIMVPVRFLKDELGCKVSYNAKEQMVTITGTAAEVKTGYNSHTIESSQSQLTVTYPITLYNNITYVSGEIITILTGKNVICKNNMGILYDGNTELSQNQINTLFVQAQNMLNAAGTEG